MRGRCSAQKEKDAFVDGGEGSEVTGVLTRGFENKTSFFADPGRLNIHTFLGGREWTYVPERKRNTILNV